MDTLQSFLLASAGWFALEALGLLFMPRMVVAVLNTRGSSGKVFSFHIFDRRASNLLPPDAKVILFVSACVLQYWTHRKLNPVVRAYSLSFTVQFSISSLQSLQSDLLGPIVYRAAAYILLRLGKLFLSRVGLRSRRAKPGRGPWLEW